MEGATKYRAGPPLEAHTSSFWKNVHGNGFDRHLTNLDEYETCSAMSVKFALDLDPDNYASDTLSLTLIVS
eukprot:3218785-Amphidinium_carterae.2